MGREELGEEEGSQDPMQEREAVKQVPSLGEEGTGCWHHEQEAVEQRRAEH